MGKHLSWLLSKGEVHSNFTKCTSPNCLLLSNRIKGSTPSLAHSLALPHGPGLLNISRTTEHMCESTAKITTCLPSLIAGNADFFPFEPLAYLNFCAVLLHNLTMVIRARKAKVLPSFDQSFTCGQPINISSVLSWSWVITYTQPSTELSGQNSMLGNPPASKSDPDGKIRTQDLASDRGETIIL